MKNSYPSGHSLNVFQAKIMPFNASTLVTCGADGQVTFPPSVARGGREPSKEAAPPIATAPPQGAMARGSRKP